MVKFNFFLGTYFVFVIIVEDGYFKFLGSTEIFYTGETYDAADRWDAFHVVI